MGAHAKSRALVGIRSGSIVLPAPPRKWKQKPAGISLCMIVKNEERFLTRCLQSAAGVVDEINIVDTGSTDRTIAIAAEFGARVERREWRNDFAWARNAALSMATRRWILVLDADEVLSEDSVEHLRRLREMPAYLHGLWIRCRNAENDRTGAAGLVNAIIRIFPNHPRLRYRNAIHEFVALDDHPNGMPANDSPIEIVHYGYTADVLHERGKGERNYNICLSETRKRPDDPFAWYNLGMSAVLAGKPQIAVDSLEKMRGLTTTATLGYVPHGLSALADLYLENGAAQQALAIAKECLTRVPTFAHAHFTCGKALVALGQLHEARDYFGAAIADADHAHEHFVVDRDLSEWKAHNEIGATLITEQRFEQALAWFDLGLENRPKAQPLRLNRARALEQLGRFAVAADAFAGAYAEFGDSLATLEYVNFLLRRGENERALTIIDEASLRLDPETAVTLLGSAASVVLRQNGAPERARAYVERALAAGRGDVDAFGLLEQLYVHLGDATTLSLLRRLTGKQRSNQPWGFRLDIASA